MWVIEGSPLDGTPFKFWLRPGKTFTIGRRDCNVTITNSTISRCHATIFASVPSPRDVADVNARTSVTLVDQSSKFGTFINQLNTRIDEPTELCEGDKVVFGTNGAYLRLLWEPVVLCPSGLKLAAKNALSDLAVECVNLKVVMALAAGNWIVTDAWVKAFAQGSPTIDGVAFEMPDPRRWVVGTECRSVASPEAVNRS
ncbi:hypothetical protein BDK51DRAFT_29895 [Blyttiomyces helicus]|uniref:FHA domain-containing protein n=1 Tax=Blyttiomyces helicus TaxID=388810 RepID=A0A4P9W126_9FUNG|nr:hypothetical protein BDK51DRAFT_29895 [Blyttiomyces helicus]|eukprot:RKO85342.1 hypothetical protein BDK51DRAFT_29895 [Blyttiomyces helicus]